MGANHLPAERKLKVDGPLDGLPQIWYSNLGFEEARQSRAARPEESPNSIERDAG